MTAYSSVNIPFIVGDGRLARHWKQYLKLSGAQFLEWNRRSHISFEHFAREHAAQISLVYLLITDSALENFYLKYREFLPAATPWFHASGALMVDGMIDAHPMMTFALEPYSKLSDYTSFSVTSTAGKAALAPLMGALKNPVVSIDAAVKPLYHALCVVGAAGTGSLWALLEDEWAAIGIKSQTWLPFQKQIFANLLENGKSAITGPWVRNDQITTDKNLAALSSRSSKKLYEVLRGVFDEHTQH